MSQPENTMASSTRAHLWILVFGLSTDLSTSPPEMMQPDDTMESSAVPRRTNFAPGSWAWEVQIGHSLLYRLNSGSTETRSMWASW